MKKKICILLAAYNGENFIKDQIYSIINQSYSVFQLIISLDFSDDKSEKIIREIISIYPNIKLIVKKKSHNQSSASNFFSLIVNNNLENFDYIGFSDQDDIWKRNKLSLSVDKLENGYDAYSSSVEAFWPDGKKRIIVKDQKQKSYDFLFEAPGPGSTFLVKKDLMLDFKNFLISNKIHLESITHFHDWLLYAFARSRKYLWFIDSHPSLYYRQHATNLFGANYGFSAFFFRVIKVLKGDGFNFSFFLARVLDIDNSISNSLYPPSRLGFIKLGFKCFLCRRRNRDIILFFIACFILAIIFPKRLTKYC